MADKPKLDHATLTNPKDLRKVFEAIYDELAALRTLANELRADHATNIASIGEIETWAETLAAKLNADAGVTDENYDATITNSPAATLAAAAVTAQTEKCK
jgi:trehalose-6-phosphate synthase